MRVRGVCLYIQSVHCRCRRRSRATPTGPVVVGREYRWERPSGLEGGGGGGGIPIKKGRRSSNAASPAAAATATRISLRLSLDRAAVGEIRVALHCIRPLPLLSHLPPCPSTDFMPPPPLPPSHTHTLPFYLEASPAKARTEWHKRQRASSRDELSCVGTKAAAIPGQICVYES